MPNQSNNNTRIAKNTFLLYFRMLFTMAVSLCTSRIGKNALVCHLLANCHLRSYHMYLRLRH